jgi:Uma2 family endonuclease
MICKEDSVRAQARQTRTESGLFSYLSVRPLSVWAKRRIVMAEAGSGEDVMVAVPEKRRLTVEEYHCMSEAGILRPEEHTELIRGEIVVMPPAGPEHAEGGSRIERAFHRGIGDRAIIRGQSPIILPNDGEPEPDVALVRARLGGYSKGHPRPEDVLLLVELSDSSLTYDRDTKIPYYAEAGIPEVWLVNLPAHRIEVYRDPAPDGYHSITIVTREGKLTPLAFPDVTFSCAELLP